MHRSYLRILERYRKNDASVSAGLVRTLVRGAAAILERWQDFHFPARAIGGWWWIERFRFEMLVRWLEYESVQSVRKAVGPGSTAIDIGAHVGYYTRLLSELVGPEGRVLAFEPHPENFAILQRNLARRRYKNVELFNCAVGARDEVLPLYVSPGNSNHSLIQGWTEAESVLSVQCVRLDSALARAGIDAVDFIKCDTEGAEPMVLDGMPGILARSPRLQMLMEFNPKALRCAHYEPDGLPVRLRQLGFEVEAIPVEGETSQNLFCRKPR